MWWFKRECDGSGCLFLECVFSKAVARNIIDGSWQDESKGEGENGNT